MSNTPSLTLEDVRGVAPALAHYTETAIIRDLWARSGLSARDRSLVTVSALVAGERTIGFAHYFTRALDSGVTPGELSELIMHVAFYAGWSTAFNAVVSLKGIFEQRGVSVDQLPPVSPDLLSVDEALPGDAARVALLQERFGTVAPGLVEITNDLLYGDVWLRPGLTPRDRNLVTVSAMIGSGQNEFLPMYLGKAVRMGVTRDELSELVTHLSFYIGWPRAISSARVLAEFIRAQSIQEPLTPT